MPDLITSHPTAVLAVLCAAWAVALPRAAWWWFVGRKLREGE